MLTVGLTHMGHLRQKNEDRFCMVEHQPDAKLLAVIDGMGCTLTAAFLSKGLVHWVHVGDSRLYHIHNDVIHQVTTDQNMAQFLYEEGQLTREEMLTSPMSNLLDQALGGSFMEADTGSFSLEPGNILLLCTDGVHDLLIDNDIANILDANSIIHRKSSSSN